LELTCSLSMSPCLNVCVRVVSDIMLRILQVCEETRTVVMESQRSIEMLKLSGLRTRTDDVAADDLVLQLIERPLASEEELESFNSQLNDHVKYKNVVSKSNLLITSYLFFTLF
jgi:hypothetical protein